MKQKACDQAENGAKYTVDHGHGNSNSNSNDNDCDHNVEHSVTNRLHVHEQSNNGWMRMRVKIES